MNSSKSDITPWYKQFWPWFLIVVPIVTLGVGTTVITLAVTGEDSLVIDDYYKQGKAINNKLEKIKAAKALNLRTEISFLDEKIELRFLSQDPNNGAALTLDFYHSTQSDKDFVINLTQRADGTYQAPIEQSLSGKWRVSLHPYHNEWKIQQDIALPQSQPILFVP
jgi:hypothetical protein